MSGEKASCDAARLSCRSSTSLSTGRNGTGELLAQGGVSFAQSLVALDVVDEYRLTVFPWLAGTGRRLFADLASSRQLELVSSTTFANSVLALTYRPYRRPR